MLVGSHDRLYAVVNLADGSLPPKHKGFIFATANYGPRKLCESLLVQYSFDDKIDDVAGAAMPLISAKCGVRLLNGVYHSVVIVGVNYHDRP